MGRARERSKANKVSAQQKAEIRSQLPSLIEEASSSREAAKAALRAYWAVRAPIPAELLDSDNIAGAFKVREIAGSLDCFSKSEAYIDISSAMTAIGKAVDKEVEGTQKRRILHSLTRSVTSKLLKLAGPDAKGRRSSRVSRSKGSSQVYFSAATVSSVADLALWLLRIRGEGKTRSKNDIYPLVIRWVETVESLWRNAPSAAALIAAMNFLRSLRTILPPFIYSKLEEQGAANFFRDTAAALPKEAKNALLDGRLNILETLFSLSGEIDDGRTHLLLELKDICQSRPSDVPPESVEWVARGVEAASPRTKAPTPVDESQSASLDYVSVCLLSAWDAASEGERSARAFENMRRMARELFKLDLVGTRGEVVSYDERQHDLRSEGATPPPKVEIVRPVVRWSDGVRTRILVRAVVRVS